MIDFFAARSGGDARSSLNALELALDTATRTGQPVTLADAEDAMQRKALRYDKSGDQHYDYISAWIKSTRGSDPDASLYYLAAMLEGGEDARFIVRRMVIFASEDVGNADPQALVVATAAAAAVEHVGLPEATYALAQAAIYLALAPKSNSAGQRAGRRAGAHPRGRSGIAARLAALRRLPRVAQARPRHRLRVPAQRARARSTTRSTCRRGARGCASSSRARTSRSCASGSPRSGGRGAVTPDALEVFAPATGARLGTVAPIDLEAAVAAAKTAQPLWSLVPVSSRARYIRRTAVAMLDELDALALRARRRDRAGRARTSCSRSCCPPSAACTRSPPTGRARSPTSGSRRSWPGWPAARRGWSSRRWA